MGIPSASAIVEERKRKGGSESTCPRGLGYIKLVLGVTKLAVLVLSGTEEAKGRGVFVFLINDFMVDSIR